MKKLITIALISSIVFHPQKIKANPAIFPTAPALCATGIGCFLVVGASVGVGIYLWRQGNKKIYAKKNGTVLKIERSENVYPLKANSWQAALRECAYILGYPPKKQIKVYNQNGRWFCKKNV